jgi:uncharacterized protein (DUF58 family)
MKSNAMSVTRAGQALPEKMPAASSVVSIDSQGLIALRHHATAITLKSKRVMASQSGAYLSPFKGRGMEFDEARLYLPGDDIRTLDWRVTARTGKPHTKLFREERERAVFLCLDYRAPMFFATRGAFKSVIASRIAATLAWASEHHGDRVGGLIFSDTEHRELRPQRGTRGVLKLLQQMTTNSAWQTSNRNSQHVSEESRVESMQQGLLRLRRLVHPGSLIFLLSDFRGLDEQGSAYLGQIARHNDVVLISITDPLEQELPAPGQYQLSNGLRRLNLNTANTRVRETYQEHFQQQQQWLQHVCKSHKMFYLPCSTSDDWLNTLSCGLNLKSLYA